MNAVTDARRALLSIESDVRNLPPQLATVSAYLRIAAAEDDHGIEARECRGLHEIVWTLYGLSERILAAYEAAVSADA